MLKTDSDLEVAGEATTFAETLELVDKLRPDIVVLDLHMPDEKNYLPESVKLQVLEHAGCILAIRLERFRSESTGGTVRCESFDRQSAAFFRLDSCDQAVLS
jgi:chemotaxis response regulator CheB